MWLSVCLAVSLPAVAFSLDESVDFNRDIRPILSDTCFKCHGPDEAEREVGLRLDSQNGFKNAAALIAPGDPENSEFLRRIQSDDQDELMPPPDSGKKLTQRQKELLSSWIQQGAKFEKHWSFSAAKKPQLPAMKDAWISNEIDTFVLQRLRQNDLTPNEIADRHTLIRRVSFGLL